MCSSYETSAQNKMILSPAGEIGWSVGADLPQEVTWEWRCQDLRTEGTAGAEALR